MAALRPAARRPNRSSSQLTLKSPDSEVVLPAVVKPVKPGMVLELDRMSVWVSLAEPEKVDDGM